MSRLVPEALAKWQPQRKADSIQPLDRPWRMMECDAAKFAGVSLPVFDAMEVPERAETIAHMIAKDMFDGYYQEQAEHRSNRDKK